MRSRERRRAEVRGRLEVANELIRVIATCGRCFFARPLREDVRISYFELDPGGRLWFVDSWRGNRICLQNVNHPWRGFHQGGTLRSLVTQLRNFVRSGTPLRKGTLGPWPKSCCDGDLWGYGKDMETVREAARRLGLLPSKEGEA